MKSRALLSKYFPFLGNAFDRLGKADGFEKVFGRAEWSFGRLLFLPLVWGNRRAASARSFLATSG